MKERKATERAWRAVGAMVMVLGFVLIIGPVYPGLGDKLGLNAGEITILMILGAFLMAQGLFVAIVERRERD